MKLRFLMLNENAKKMEWEKCEFCSLSLLFRPAYIGWVLHSGDASTLSSRQYGLNHKQLAGLWLEREHPHARQHTHKQNVVLGVCESTPGVPGLDNGQWTTACSFMILMTSMAVASLRLSRRRLRISVRLCCFFFARVLCW